MNFKKQKGITLIALVITIIVLLILAGVTLNLVFKNDGIITQADTAKIKQQEETDMQEITLAVSAEDLNVSMNGGTRNVDNIKKELKKKYGSNVDVITTSNNKMIVTVEGRNYNVDTYGNVVKYEGKIPTPEPTPTMTSTPVQTPTTNPGDVIVAVESVTIEGDMDELEIGDTMDLTVTILPSNATNQEVIWWVDDDNLAWIDDEGYLETYDVRL